MTCPATGWPRCARGASRGVAADPVARRPPAGTSPAPAARPAPSASASPALPADARPAPSAGYSGTPLPRKLGIKPGHVIALIGAPAGFAGTLEPLPERVTVQAGRAAGPATRPDGPGLRTVDRLAEAGVEGPDRHVRSGRARNSPADRPGR